MSGARFTGGVMGKMGALDMSGDIHLLQLPQPSTRADMDMTLAEMVLRMALEGRKVSILYPREGEVQREPIELPAASDDYGCPICGMRAEVAHNHMLGQELDREEAARMVASKPEGEGSSDEQ